MAKKIIDLRGQHFGRLVVVGFRGMRYNQATWLCKCSCGNQSVVLIGNLRSGSTKSCGCLKIEVRNKHNQDSATHRMTGTRPYRIWNNMKDRCFNKNSKDYNNYGGRGIRVCPQWDKSFEAFWADMGPTYGETLQLDRRDNNGNYEPKNCRWVTAKEQINNTRVNKLITYKGKTKTQSQWSDELKIHRAVIAHRLKVGWSIHDALNTPVKTYKKHVIA